MTERKLSDKDVRELQQLPVRIEQLDADVAAKTAVMNDPGFYQQNNGAILRANDALSAVQAELDAAHAWWTEPES